MFKTVLLFLAITAFFYVGIRAVRHLTGREKFDVAITVAYSVMCAGMAIGALGFIIWLF